MIDLERHQQELKQFWNADPFPHVRLENFWDEDFANSIYAELPKPDSDKWNGYYNNQVEFKRSLNVWDRFEPHVYRALTYLCSKEFTDYLSEKLGIPGLIPDVGLHGGGIHYYPPGGKLNPHVDYSHHPKLGYRRKLNLLVYFNKHWSPEFGGQLGLWKEESAKNYQAADKMLRPDFNSCVIFESTPTSYHGLAKPASENHGRYSMALYYMVNDGTSSDANKAYFLPTADQKDDPSVQEIIEIRKKQRVNNQSNANKVIRVATRHPTFGVMMDHDKIPNGLYRFQQQAPTMFYLQQIIKDKLSPRNKLIDIRHTITCDPATIPEDEKYIIASNVASHPNQWTGKLPGLEKNLHKHDLPERENLFECLAPDCLKDLQTGRAQLLLDQTHEGYSANYLWAWFYGSCKLYDVKPSQVIFITGDFLSPNHHQNYCRDNGITKDNQIKVISHALFEEAVYNASIYEWKHDVTNFDENYAYKKANLHNPDIKAYNCLQKRPRGHRIWLFDELVEHDLLKYGINTMNYIENSERGIDGKVYWSPELKTAEQIDRMNSILPLMPEKEYTHYKKDDVKAFADECSGKWQMMFNREIVLDSWVSIISEANASTDQCFLSEKIFKPLLLEHPFMVWGDRHTLHKLRELGYRTYGEFWNEDYDVGPTRKRLDGLVRNIKQISRMTPEEMLKMYKDMEPILKHNSNLIKSISTVELRDHIKFLSNIIK